MLLNPESDVEPDRESNVDNLEGEDENETVVTDTGLNRKKAPSKVRFEEAKVTKQQPLPPKVDKGPG